MKKILTVFCWVMAIYAVWFPFSYFGKDADKKEIRISHILVETPEQAQNIKQDIDNGKSFEDMAKEHSLCPSKEDGGDIGYTQRGRLAEDLDKAAFTLAEGTVSEPLPSPAGWHLIKIKKVEYFSDKDNFKYDKFKYLDL